MAKEHPCVEDTMNVALPCGHIFKVERGELERVTSNEMWSAFCRHHCPRRFGEKVVIMCDALRDALPWKGIRESITGRVYGYSV